MKRFGLFLTIGLVLMTSCTSTKKKSSKSVLSSSTSSSVVTSSGTNSSSVTSSSATTSDSSTTSSSATSSSSTPTSSTTTSTPPTPSNFGFDETEITVDLKDSKTIDLTALYSQQPSNKISWSFSLSNCLRAEKTITTHNETNTIQLLNVGDTTIHVSSGSLHDELVVHVVNTTPKKTTGTEKVSLYAVNDYHGAVNGTFNLATYGTFIKQKVSQANTLFLDQGDTWQGTLKSNYNYGRMITDVYNAAGMSARTVGNHDFDWGIYRLEENTKANYHGYSTPVLAANVYDYDFNTHTIGANQQSNIGREYSTFTLESGIKVGVVGVIGDTNERAIMTENAKTLEFIEMGQVIKNVSDKLRNEEKCDIVIASMHEGFGETSYKPYSYVNDITQVSPVTGKKYVDAVLNAHTHQVETNEVNGVPFVQFGSSNEYVGKLDLTFDYESGQVSSYSRYSLSTSTIVDDIDKVDSEIKAIVDSYNDKSEALGNTVLTEHLNGSFSRYEAMPNMVCTAMYEEAIKQGYDISYAVCNNTRQNLSGPIVTYESLFNALPFNNAVYIIEISGSDMYYRFINTQWWYFYRGDNDEARAPIDSSREKYTIACIDYVAFHANAARNYDYFPSAKVVGYLTMDEALTNYRDITANYMKSIDGIIDASSYSSSNIRYNYAKVTEPLP